MKYYNSVLDLIGNTPLVKLNKLTDSSMATVLVKLENLNPGGSVKDRMAAHVIKRAEEKGLIKPGDTLVESTSGNTGLGLALAAAIKGYRLVVTIPDKMSQEKIDMLKAYGAEVIVTPTSAPHGDPENYVEVALRIARETPNAFYTNQYDNPDNPEIHYLTTGPEIWDATAGKIDAFVCGIGTGGTVSGTGKYLKEQAKKAGRDVQVICGDPEGSVYLDALKKRKLREPKPYKVEGIGHDYVVDNVDFSVIDDIVIVNDRESFHAARRLTREEGIFSGGSTGTIIHATLQVAKDLGPGKTIVSIICDSGDRYISKFYSDAWMKDMGFFGHEKLGFVKDILKFKGSHVEYAEANQTVRDVASRMNELGISQMPVKAERGTLLMVDEVDLLQNLLAGNCHPDDKVVSVATRMEGLVVPEDTVSSLQNVFEENKVAIVVDNGSPVGVITKIDLVRFLSSKG